MTDYATIAKRAEITLKKFENSRPNEIDLWDVLDKVNEALRLIKALAEQKNG